jgi:predicted membrane protein
MALIIGVILIIIGLSALFGDFLFKLAFAIILIAIGARILMRNSWKWRGHSEAQEDYINEVGIFSPLNKNITSNNFRGGKIVAIFSGGEINLSQVKTSHVGVSMEIVAIFGGAKLIVPKDWKVISSGSGIIGGFNNRTQGTGNVTLHLKGVAIFGGVEVIS